MAASNNGQPPGQKLFAKETGILEHHWRGNYWARWSDALAEAGYEPNDWNGRLDTQSVMTSVLVVCRHLGRVPTRDEIDLYRKSDPSVPRSAAVARHLGGRAEMIEAIRAHAATDPAAFSDIASMLPPATQSTAPIQSKAVDGFVYLIKSGEFYKIGRSADLERRVKEIRVAMPDKAELTHSIRTDDPAGIEAYWHRRFADRRANGEWFKLTALDVAAFRKRKFQ